MSTAEKRRIITLLQKEADERNVDITINRSEIATDGLQKCPAATSLIHINAYGQVSPCSWIGKLWPDLIELPTENIFRVEILNTLDERVRQITDPKCNTCALGATCGRGCPAIAYFEEGHYDRLCDA